LFAVATATKGGVLEHQKEAEFGGFHRGPASKGVGRPSFNHQRMGRGGKPPNSCFGSGLPQRSRKAWFQPPKGGEGWPTAK